MTFIGFSLPFLGLWSINHDGWDGTAPNPLVWSVGTSTVHSCRGHLTFGNLSVNVHASAVCAEDVAHWPYTSGLFVKWVALLGSLHWPVRGADLGVGGAHHAEMPILYELWAGERLALEKGSSSLSSARASKFSVGCSFWSRH